MQMRDGDEWPTVESEREHAFLACFRNIRDAICVRDLSGHAHKLAQQWKISTRQGSSMRDERLRT